MVSWFVLRGILHGFCIIGTLCSCCINVILYSFCINVTLHSFCIIILRTFDIIVILHLPSSFIFLPLLLFHRPKSITILTTTMIYNPHPYTILSNSSWEMSNTSTVSSSSITFSTYDRISCYEKHPLTLTRESVSSSEGIQRKQVHPRSYTSITESGSPILWSERNRQNTYFLDMRELNPKLCIFTSMP